MAAYEIIPIEHNIKQAITAAVRAVEFKKYHVDEDEVVTHLLTDIFRALFPNNPSLVDVKKVETALLPITPAPVEEPEVVVPTLPASPKPKKPRAKKEKVVEEPVVAGAGAAAASGEPEKKKGRAKKEKPEGKHLSTLNPSQKKVLKKENVDPKEFLEYVNAMTEDQYKAKTIEEHAQEFKKPKVEIVEFVDKDMTEVQFNGKTYFVDDEKKVYIEDGDVAKVVGHVGMLEFADMVVPVVE